MSLPHRTRPSARHLIATCLSLRHLRICVSWVSLFLVVAMTGCAARDAPVYSTYGVHNAPSVSPCATAGCVYERGPAEPTDPIYPQYWVSDWNMYRVFEGYAEFPPPYGARPPAGTKFEKSTGTTYYDSTWTGRGGAGAMMEFYEKRCLPIFPISNRFTCAFISLGDTAFFVTYDEDRPEDMPPVCLFSDFNHPPRRDFIKHLPYSQDDSLRIGAGGQGYSFWVSATTGKPVQVGVKPDRTAEHDIMFGYGFMAKGAKVLPQSFYFSGFPLAPSNAPMVTQIYTDFREIKPDPATTWDQVSSLNPDALPLCRLFDPPAGPGLMTATQKPAPTWSDIGRWKKP